jgi:hypothetical protein
LWNDDAVSKAFTKEDEDAGFVAPAAKALPAGLIRLTATAARRLGAIANGDARAREILARAELLPAAHRPERAVLGVTVRVRDEDGGERAYRLVTAEELALVPDDHACSTGSPIGRALPGAGVGDVREIRAPNGTDDLANAALLGHDAAGAACGAAPSPSSP